MTHQQVKEPSGGAKRLTRQRAAVVAELNARTQFRSAQTIHEDLAGAGHRIGLATVYRNLRALADEGEVDVLLSPEGEALYRCCDVGSHHHHLVCRHCLRSEEIEAGVVERWVRSLGEQYGFIDLEHSLEVYGTCRECAKTHSE